MPAVKLATIGFQSGPGPPCSDTKGVWCPCQTFMIPVRRYEDAMDPGLTSWADADTQLLLLASFGAVCVITMLVSAGLATLFGADVEFYRSEAARVDAGLTPLVSLVTDYRLIPLTMMRATTVVLAFALGIGMAALAFAGYGVGSDITFLSWVSAPAVLVGVLAMSLLWLIDGKHYFQQVRRVEHLSSGWRFPVLLMNLRCWPMLAAFVATLAAVLVLIGSLLAGVIEFMAG